MYTQCETCAWCNCNNNNDNNNQFCGWTIWIGAPYHLGLSEAGLLVLTSHRLREWPHQSIAFPDSKPRQREVSSISSTVDSARSTVTCRTYNLCLVGLERRPTWHFFFHFNRCTQFCIAGLQESSPKEPKMHQNSWWLGLCLDPTGRAYSDPQAP